MPAGKIRQAFIILCQGNTNRCLYRRKVMTAELILLLIVIVVALFTFQGYKQGFLRIIFSFVSILLAIWLVVKISPVISDYLMEKTKISNVTEKKIMEIFEEKNSERDNTIYENQIETIYTTNWNKTEIEYCLENGSPFYFNDYGSGKKTDFYLFLLEKGYFTIEDISKELISFVRYADGNDNVTIEKQEFVRNLLEKNHIEYK